ncbi:class I SAM-dependent methyltransferase [Acinetobacter sp. 2JN-4]|uniref:class I SAM-dependent methyltransferase n=1 Tax=Acinetobacter sp. 2JN-4 TaxID=2479844 RepID=UPI000EFA16C0|nr:class I SAM-dependent methyltransferase [Acinetobacter sp. 2JN-4]RLZ07914.1 class I SAM-dependent methyltransferase [Acinetobacter sp. 2JN-4]
MSTQHQVNQSQYHNKSNAYLHSLVHAEGAEFKKMQQLIQKYEFKKILDLGCGGGHVSYHIAPYVEEIIAYDLTPSMVELVTTQAKVRGFENIFGQQGAAESLPFSTQRFDCVITRYSAHHWQNVAQAMNEIHRVLEKNGKVIIVDILGNSHPVIDTFFQTIEKIRDPSHVRNYSLQEWMDFAEFSGFRVDVIEKQTLDLEFQSWVERMNTPKHAVQTIRDLQKKASTQTQQYYQVQADGSFTSEVLWMVLTK